MSHQQPLLAVRNLARSFERRTIFKRLAPVQAVRNVSFSLAGNETLAIVGESGCGKSTLARMLLGITSFEGEVKLSARNAREMSQRDFARLVQPVFQDPFSSLNPSRTMLASVEQPLSVHGIGDPQVRRSTATALLEAVGLPQRLHRNYPRQLSGGQRQRVAIARALVLKPQLVICDEPTSALDVSIQAQILNLLRDMQEQFGLAYILISHNLGVVRHLADRIAVMYLGRIVEMGDTAAVLSRPAHPYTRALLSSVLSPDSGRGLPARQIKAEFPDPSAPPSGCGFHTRCPFAAPECAVKQPAHRQLAGREVECHFAERMLEIPTP